MATPRALYCQIILH